jgi:hypothetical protein
MLTYLEFAQCLGASLCHLCTIYTDGWRHALPDGVRNLLLCWGGTCNVFFETRQLAETLHANLSIDCSDGVSRKEPIMVE